MYCKFCPTSYKKANTSNLVTHIKEKHPEQIKPTDQMSVMDMIKGKLARTVETNSSSSVSRILFLVMIVKSFLIYILIYRALITTKPSS